ncbi:hypothetical protein D918_04021 [Trichuris suis]|nr:hypothetical protein D918_04021 [Trichuris suis]
MIRMCRAGRPVLRNLNFSYIYDLVTSGENLFFRTSLVRPTPLVVGKTIYEASITNVTRLKCMFKMFVLSIELLLLFSIFVSLRLSRELCLDMFFSSSFVLEEGTVGGRTVPAYSSNEVTKELRTSDRCESV